MDSNNIIQQEKALEKKRRNRTILWLRLCSGIKEVAARPLKGIPIILLCAAFAVIWNIRDKINPYGGNSQFLFIIYGYFIAFLIPIIFVLMLAGVLLLLGTPLRAKAIENNLLQILFNRYGHAPALVSRKPIRNTNVNVMEFYSLGVGMEKWEKHSAEVQDALNIHFVEPIKYGGKNGRNRNLIVITAAPGVGLHREDKLYDDEI